MNIDTTCNKLREMRFTHMAQQLEERIANGDHRDLSHEQFIGLLVEDEYLHRQQKKLDRLVNRAGFKPEQPAMENITYTGSRGVLKKDFIQFSTPKWITNAQNVVFTGPTGCGKSFLAQAIALQACRMGFSSRYIRYTMLFEEINVAKGTGMYLKYLKKLAATKVLILDDFVMQEVSAQDLSSLMDIIEEKQQTGSIIVTTQYPIAKWHHRMVDPTIADAICDRITANAYKFNLKGDGGSMRKKI